MKKLIALSLLACACGDWSNEDIEYLYALPQKDLLKSQLGDMASTGQGVRRDPLLGDTSNIYQATKTQAEKFNEFLDTVLTGLDTLRTIHPTKREKNKRIWGPYPDDQHAGFDSKVEIVKVSDKRFEWSIQARKRGTDSFTKLGGGWFEPTASLRKGRGSFSFDGSASDALYQESKNDFDSFEIGYKTDADPVIVEIDVTVGGVLSPFGWVYNGYADESAALTFTFDDVKDAGTQRLNILAAWDPTTAGEARYTVISGEAAGAIGLQCWDVAQKIVYEQVTLPDGGVYSNGPKASCVKVPELMPLP